MQKQLGFKPPIKFQKLYHFTKSIYLRILALTKRLDNINTEVRDQKLAKIKIKN